MSTVDPVARKIRAARLEAGISRERLAATLGVSLATVIRYETGRSTEISMKKMLVISKATGKPLAYFVGKAAA